MDYQHQNMPQNNGYQAQQPMMNKKQGPPPKGGEWQSSLLNCTPCSSCCLACFLPCVLLGKTSSRLEDPTLQSYKTLNSDCMIMTLATCFGLGCVYTAIKRSEIRERFGVRGSLCADFCTSCCCGCCALIQQDKEVSARVGQPPNPMAAGYHPNPGMSVPGHK